MSLKSLIIVLVFLAGGVVLDPAARAYDPSLAPWVRKCAQSGGYAPGCGNAPARPPPSYAPPQADQEEQTRKAADADKRGMDALDRGDFEEAVDRFIEALRFAPDSATIRAHLERANAAVADSGTARRIAALRQRIRDAIKIAEIEAARQSLEDQETPHAGVTGRHYTFAGNGLIAGTSWTVYASRTPGETAKRMCDVIERQSRLAGSPFDAGVDCEHYQFVLGMATSIDNFTDLKNRVALDDLTNGQFSAREQGLYDKLRGKQFNELGCHSNGAMICLAALENMDVKADHVVLYGPQVTRESLAMWDELVRSGRVKSIKVYINENDIVPGSAIVFADQIGGGVGASRELPLFQIDSLKQVINETSPRLLVQTFPCSRDRLSFDCHSMAMYKAKVNCTSKPSGKTVPGAGLHGNDDLPEPPLPCDAIGSN